MEGKSIQGAAGAAEMSVGARDDARPVIEIEAATAVVLQWIFHSVSLS